MHIPRSVKMSDQIVPSLVRRSPGRSCAGQRRTKNPRGELIRWLFPASLAHLKTFESRLNWRRTTKATSHNLFLSPLMFWDFGSLYFKALRRHSGQLLRQRHSTSVETLRRPRRGSGAHLPAFNAMHSDTGQSVARSACALGISHIFHVKRFSVTLVHMKKVIKKATVRVFGHFDNEINFADSEGSEGMKIATSSLRSVFRPTWTTSTSCQRAR